MWDIWINRVTLCPECHEKVHNGGALKSVKRLTEFRNLRLLEYYNFDLRSVLENANFRLGSSRTSTPDTD